MPSLHDTRLLSNLLKTEKDAMQAFKHYTVTASSAGAALSAWSVTDSADTGDIMDAALRISQLLSSLTDAQRSYLHALSTYRASLKDVLARETALRTVVRDREILVNRLIKIGNKRPKDKEGAVEEHQAKLDDAQRELRACETYLQEEELALSHAKRRSFRDGLAQRMRSMAELARVMEESAREAVGILGELEGEDGEERDEGDFHPSHHLHNSHPYDLGSEAGDSIAPSQSASQAMSRASSSSSLSSLRHRHANAPPLPTNLHIDPRPSSPRHHRTRSVSPPARAPAIPTTASASPSRAKTAQQQHQPAFPQMPAVPSAPPPIAQTVYTERTPGLPTFEIPRAPDLSRRADESSDEEEGTEVEQGRMRGRSSHYPLDSPPLVQPAYQPSRLTRGGGGGGGRRAASDTSSIHEGGGRKRRGSFLGGLAALFSRKGGRKEDRPARAYVSEGGGGGEYGGARSRLATSAYGTGGGGAAEEAVRRSVMNAGLRPAPAQRAQNLDPSSSDDDLPRHTVRHVNDPKQRFKAFSDVGRPSPPVVAKAVREKRPALQRKGTGQSKASTVRPTSVNGDAAGGEPKKVKRKVKKAASDIGAPTSSSSAWTRPEVRLGDVPKAPATNGLAPLSGPPPLPANLGYSTAPSSTPAPASGTATPRGDTESLKKRKKKSAAPAPAGGGGGGGETVVLSAEALGIPTSATTTPVTGLSRSGTVKSTATTGGETLKKKKKRAGSVSVPPPIEEKPQGPLPTAEDLSSTLPSAKSSSSTFNTQLPRPDDDPYASKSTRPLSTSVGSTNVKKEDFAPAPAVSRAVSEKKKDKSAKRLSALHGVGTVGEGNFIVHPPITHAPIVANGTQHDATATATRTKPTQVHRMDVREGEESLLSVVDRAEGGENRTPSRSYGAPAAAPAAATNGNTLAVPSAATSSTSSSTAGAAGGPPSTPQLNKRKSVRLGEVINAESQAGLSPSNSVRSASSTTGERRGILVQRDPSPVPGSAAASLGHSDGGGGGAWPTRGSIRAAMDDDTSSDEGGAGGAGGKSSYWAARKMLGRGTREYEGALRGEEVGGKRDKGKGRAE
ncbi:hypothetical protein JCM11251_004005 [Rhodosporidiobolus azoricus]